MRVQLLASLGGWHIDWDDWFDFDWLNEAGVVLQIVARVGVAYFVYRDATRRPRLLFNMPPWLWAVMVLAFGLWGGVAYWLANCSGLLRQEAGPPARRPPSS